MHEHLRRTDRTRRRRHRGGTSGALLGTLCTAGIIVTAAVVVAPSGIFASGRTPPPEPVRARVAAHQQVIDLLATLVARSRAVIAVHPRTQGPYFEVVLWLDDRVNRGTVDLEEVAVLAHSALLETVTLYVPPAALDDTVDDDGPPRVPATAWSDIDDPAFCTWWRSRADVERRSLATGVSSMEVQWLHAAPETSEALLRMRLTWSEESTDGLDEAAVLVHGVDGAKE